MQKFEEVAVDSVQYVNVELRKNTNISEKTKPLDSGPDRFEWGEKLGVENRGGLSL